MKVKLSANEILKDCRNYAKKIKNFVVEDSAALVNQMIEKGGRILLEGAQGTMLDVDHGTYPYVTSSNPVAGGACAGAGIGPTMVKRIIGVVKAYVRRVGSGPFPTEMKGGIGDILREKGGEYGATTGRPRRCGWFDVPLMRHATRVNGLTHLAVTKLDVLDNLDEINICTGYDYEGKIIKDFPLDIHKLAKCRPVYQKVKGWEEDITKIKNYENLPKEARKYLEKISELVGVKISLVSIGAERGQIIRV